MRRDDIKILFLKNVYRRKEWLSLLHSVGLERITEKDASTVDRALALYIGDKMIGTVSCQGKLIKYLAIDPDYRENGKTFNRLLSAMINQMNAEGYFHYLVLTKPTYQTSFASLGFEVVALGDDFIFMEKGMQNLHHFLNKIPKKMGKNAAIVMNANPFTLGHRFLIEKASQENDWVYVFLLDKEQSFITSKERRYLLSLGIKDLSNVVVVSGGDYVISPATFPTYFLRKDDAVARFQMRIDAEVFRQSIAPYLSVTKRYIGQEPYSDMTDSYNSVLKKTLLPQIEVIEVTRATTASGEIISASKVRQAYCNNCLEKVRDMLPKTTYDYLKTKRGIK